MDAYPSTPSDSLSTLCERLRSERLLVNSEQETLQQLNSTVDTQLAELNQLTWVSQQEKLVLRRLVNSDPLVRPENCCQLVATINAARFKEGYRGVGHHAASISQVFRLLLSSPRAVAEFLSAADQLPPKEDPDAHTTDELCRSVFNMLYGSCSFPGDERSLLDVLANLITLQLVPSPEPRKLLRKGNTAFSRVYHLFTEQLFSAKVFLTAALHEPIMFLLSQDELFLDTDPSKSPIRFPVEERRRRFGVDENSKVYKDRVAIHRKAIVEKLVTIGNQFLKAIQAAIPCFPSSIIWLVRQLHTSLIERKRITKEEAALICTDLIFTYFLCPAITNPEPLGVISDTPISYIARFNLMQVGQILQTLALLPYEQPPTYFMSLLSRFDQECMPRIVGRILSSDSVSIETMFPNIVAGPNGSELYARKACVGSLQEVNVLHSYLRSSAVDQMSDSAIAKELKNTMRRMPDEFTTTENSHQEGTISPGASESLLRSRPSSSARLRNLAGRVQTAASKGQQRFLQNSPSRAKSPHDDNSPNQRSSESNAVNADDAIREVYIFSLMDDSTPLGLEPEEKIMQSFRSTRKHRSSENATEKKTRFMTTESVISDRTSTEAASDDEEEGAGSVSSSLNDNVDEVDAEDVEVDNFSDVVPISANVSGRGSPSLSGERMSGRDTPFSANAADQNDTATVSSTIAGAANLATDAKRNLPSLPVTVRKQNPEGLEEKFGKFGLPPTDPSRYRDETYSLVSDSWSTDVVASDNEGLGESRQDAAQQLFAQNAPPALAAGLAAVFPGLVPHNALAPAVQLPADPNAPPDPPQLQQRLAVGGVQRHPRNPSGVPEDRSDTWSLDATASDSEADAVANAANTEQDLLVLDDLPNLPEGQASSGNPGGASRRTPTTASYSATSAGPAPMLRRKSSQPSAELESLPEADIPGPSGISLPVISSAFSNANELTSRDRIRRQSSGGSSFYSRSDVDSEFSKDNEEPLINFAAEALQRTASGDVPVEPINFVSDPISPAKKAGTFTTSCTLPLQSVSSSTTSSAAVTPKGSQTRNGCYPIPRGSSDDLDTIPPVPTSSAACAQRDTLAKSKSFAPTETPSPERSTPLAGTNSSGRRLNLIHQGLQRVGATLKRNKGVVSFGQSMTHSATVDDLASISVAFARNGTTGLRNSGRARLAESHSVGHIVDVSEENGDASSMTVNAAERQRVADDILNKYRAMPSPISASAANSFAGILLDARPLDAGSAVQPIVNTDQPYYDPTNIVQCKAFADAKRKLRLVLSSAANVPTNGTARATGMSISGIIIDAGGANKNNAVETNQDTHGLTEFLKLLLAESINSQDKTLSAQIREVQRCLAIFDAKGIRKLLRTMKEDHRRRTSYVLYLQHSRITLLQLNSYLGKLGNRIKREKALTNECLIEVLVRFYLEKNEQFLRRFIHDFQMLKANDEKTDAVDRALRFLCERMLIEPMWRSSTQDSLDYARKSLERSLMAQIYVFALYPNGDADQSRDEVFFKSMQRLAAAITPYHPELRIPKQYHGECPWPSAQAEIAIINAYKSPRDKMACVVRCCETIENLIILASERGTASADDITPILVFVLLQANPPGLFSNIQYINGFYAARMEGGESYWWTQFTSAVEFIKQMLNKS